MQAGGQAAGRPARHRQLRQDTRACEGSGRGLPSSTPPQQAQQRGEPNGSGCFFLASCLLLLGPGSVERLHLGAPCEPLPPCVWVIELRAGGAAGNRIARVHSNMQKGVGSKSGAMLCVRLIIYAFWILEESALVALWPV